MTMTRRTLLKGIAKNGGMAIAAGAVCSGAIQAHAEEAEPAPAKNAVAMLYDSTRCIGCQSCVTACSQANNMPMPKDALYRDTHDLNASVKTVVRAYRPEGGQTSFIKQQCMHCVDPACVAACMFKALKKDPKTGVVTWAGNLCVGCRYCEVVCPYNVPKFEWRSINAKIVKCEFCGDRLAKGEETACASVCPTQAIVFGTRSALLDAAHKRIQENPGKYYENRVFGEHDGGGTQVLYLARTAFEKLGLPKLDSKSIPATYLKWQKKIYSYMVAPAVTYALLVGIIRKNWKNHLEHAEKEEKDTGLRPQL